MRIEIIKNGITYEVLYDECDHMTISIGGWYITNDGYLRSSSKSSMHPKSTLLHRHLLKVSDRSICVDHINRNKLDNRRSNLRLCTISDNCKNRTPRGRSKYLGVTVKNKSIKKNGDLSVHIYAQINTRGRSIHLGKFKTEEEAAHAYDAAAKIHHGEFANLNFK